MNCVNCGFENKPGAKFCASCGVQLPESPVLTQPERPAAAKTCQNCGFENLPEAAFCGKCGAQMPEAPAPAPKECKDCGFENKPGETACENCGEQTAGEPAGGTHTPDLKKAASEAAKKLKSLPFKTILAALIAVIAVAAVIVVLIVVLRPSRYSMENSSIHFFDDKDAVTVSAGGSAKFSIEGEMISSLGSMDGATSALLTQNSDETVKTLWLVTVKGAVRIADGVEDYRIAGSGKGVLYFTDYNQENETASLHLYDTVSQKSDIISDEAFYTSYDYTACISPDGKTVGFVSDYDEEARELTGYIKAGNNPVERLGKNVVAVAAADGGKYLYYARLTDSGASLYVKSGDAENRLIADYDPYVHGGMFFTEDCSQMIFHMDGRSYISRNGGERVKISNSEINSLIVPDRVQTGAGNFVQLSASVYGVKSFASLLGDTGDGIVRIGENFEAVEVSGIYSSSVYQPAVSEDGKRLLYIDYSGDLYVIDPAGKNARAETLAEEVTFFMAAGDGKTVYFRNEYDELWVVKGNGKPGKIADDVSGICSLSPGGGGIYYLMDYSDDNGGILYYANSGGEREKIAGADAVMNLWASADTVFYETAGSEVYRSSGGKPFEMFFERPDTAD
ncbi:MAG: zinc ribbon domain-containing protein [Oscillospiraceae bacterium]|jgi:energy-converting hydrogenase Eha subunit A|nr:zinc ribbon domain-containing protein [Oscillospiraceae bacterium]